MKTDAIMFTCSQNVMLVRDRNAAHKLINKAFGKGFNQYDAWGSLKERWRKYRLGTANMKVILYPEPTQVFLKWLRRTEWHYNANGLLHKLLFLLAYHRYRKISLKTGFSIPKNVCGYGLSLPHYGSIVINANCKIGENCRIQNNVNIGATGGSNKAHIIGNNVYIGPGAVIYGDIVIADNCYIGANAVVNKSFTEPYSVIAGVPAKLIRFETANWSNNN